MKIIADLSLNPYNLINIFRIWTLNINLPINDIHDLMSAGCFLVSFFYQFRLICQNSISVFKPYGPWVMAKGGSVPNR